MNKTSDILFNIRNSIDQELKINNQSLGIHEKLLNYEEQVKEKIAYYNSLYLKNIPIEPEANEVLNYILNQVKLNFDQIQQTTVSKFITLQKNLRFAYNNYIETVPLRNNSDILVFNADPSLKLELNLFSFLKGSAVNFNKWFCE